MDPSELSRIVQHLNSDGGFDGALSEEKIVEVIGSVSAQRAEKIFKDLEEQKATVKDPTAWVTSAMRKAGGGGGGGGGGFHGAPGSDEKLRKRIGWLNGDGGGFQGAIIYDKVVAASGGLPYSEVMRVLKDLEEKKDDVKDPNAWACSALRKAGGGGHQAAAAAFGFQPQWGAPPAMAAGWHGGPPIGGGYGFAPSASYSDPRADQSKIAKRVDWLNGQGGFSDALVRTKVLEAASGADVQQVMKVLKDVEEKKDQVKDPNAYVTSALRKLGGGSRAGSMSQPMPAMGGWAGPPAVQSRWGGPDPVQAEDQKLRKRIGWLNGQGGFNGAIVYDKILEAAGGLEFSEVFSKLQQLEEKGDSVKDPTAWVCTGLRRSASKGVGGGPPMAPQGWATGGWPIGGGAAYGGGGPAYGDSYGTAGPMDVDSHSKLHKRIKWLNGTGGFNDSLDFQKVTEAAAGLDVAPVLKVLKDLEEKKDTVKNPTSYVTSALRKAGGGSQGGKGMPGVKKTILKR